MKRYEFEQQHGELGQMRLESDGEWIRYEDHVEAMKRIAGAPVAQGLTVEQLELFAAGLVKRGELNWAGFRQDEEGWYTIPVVSPSCYTLVTALLAQAAPSASAQQAEPMGVMAMVRLHNEIQRDLAAPAPSAQQAEPVANNEAYDLAYDKIDRFLRSNLDDDGYAEFSRALDSLFAAPAPASPAAAQHTETK